MKKIRTLSTLGLLMAAAATSQSDPIKCQQSCLHSFYNQVTYCHIGTTGGSREFATCMASAYAVKESCMAGCSNSSFEGQANSSYGYWAY